MLSQTAQRAIEAYGGKNFWTQALRLEAEVSANGLAFTLKRRSVFEHAKLILDLNEPFAKLTPIGKNKNLTGILKGNDVWLEDASGKIVSERKNARSFFPFGRRLLYWDDLDMTYFANYAFWNYFSLPKSLMNTSIVWTEKQDGVLQAVFPESIPTHSQKQEFHFDKNSGLLVQHNYTVDIISKFATAANVITQHSSTNGITFASERVVTPMSRKGKALKGPVLIHINVHSCKII